MLTDVQSLTNQTTLGQKPNKGSNELGKDQFLKLLTTQLANQDPTSPMENTEFIAQLAQFSSLEGITNMNKTLESLVAVNAADNAANAVTLIGKEVRYATKNIDGAGKLSFQVAKDADQVTIKFKDSKGAVNTISGLKGKANELNRVDLSEYAVLKPGERYEFEIAAETKAGEKVEIVASASAIVTGIDYSGNSPVVHFADGHKASTADVLEIRLAPVVAPAPVPQPEEDPASSEDPVEEPVENAETPESGQGES